MSIGVIADDITGACDVAAGVTSAGLSAEVRLGIPDAAEPTDAACVVVALKSRTAPSADAVAASVASAAALRSWHVQTLYQKYCSTFDSTDEGNIGPVADALLDLVGPTAASIGTPATPRVGRTVHRGHLFVGDRLLSESSLARHPLTPMTDPDLVRVLGRQTSRPVGCIPIEAVRAGVQAVRDRIDALRSAGVRHLLADAVEDEDLDVLATATAGMPDVVLGGAAGLVAAVARRVGTAADGRPAPAPSGRRLLLSGSASERTRAQVAAFAGRVFVIDADAAVRDPEAVIAAALAFVAGAELPLVSATADPPQVHRAQAAWGAVRAAAAVEHVLGRVAQRAVADLGVRRILVAGGETSGAVAQALQVRRLHVRRVVSVGVPWMTAADPAGRRLDLCFKSGNFGEVDLFTRAWEEG